MKKSVAVTLFVTLLSIGAAGAAGKKPLNANAQVPEGNLCQGAINYRNYAGCVEYNTSPKIGYSGSEASFYCSKRCKG